MDLNPHVAMILERRGIGSGELESFFTPDYDRDVHDPFLFDDMERAVKRIRRAVERRERITVYGDYDVDGVSGAVILRDVLVKAGADVSLFFNHRENDGYGLHRHCIDRIAQQETRLMITTDSGIANAGEIEYARMKGIDTIITDHHTPPACEEDLPPAYAIIHPLVHADRYPWKQLSGGGCAFKLAQALCRTLPDTAGVLRHEEKWLLDLVALSILSDRVSLLGENRALFYFGVKVLKKSRRAGLRALFSRTPPYYQSALAETLHYHVIPLLNAAGRMEHATIAADLLCTDDDSVAEGLADTLMNLNKERQRLTQRTVRGIPGSILANGSLFLAGAPHWRLGLLGLVAGKLVSAYRKPVLLMRTGSSPFVGVARSTPDIDIAKTFNLLSGFFDRFGGHASAGGFALKESVSLERFIEAVEGVTPVRRAPPHDAGSAVLRVELSLSHLSSDFVADLARCEPWGVGNPPPLFFFKACVILTCAPLGNRKQWIRIRIKQAEAQATLRIAVGDLCDDALSGAPVNIECRAEISEWRGLPNMRLTATSLKLLNPIQKSLLAL